MKIVKIIGLVIIIGIGIYGLFSFKNINSNEYTLASIENDVVGNVWDDYTNWYKITNDAPNTGDPTGFIEKKHNGMEAYREIYINDIGKAVNLGSAPYKYPEGTIIVKESYENKKRWQKKGKKLLTVMIKQAEGVSPETDDWGYVDGARGKLSIRTSKKAKFCSGCHVYAASKDYVFMNSDFIKDLK